MKACKCENCGSDFMARNSQAGRFCSLDCMFEFKSRNVVLYTCESCGKEIRGSADKVRRFCSRKCEKTGVILRNTKVCRECGSDYSRQPSSGKGGFCSLSCWYAYHDKHGLGKSQIISCKHCGKEFEEFQQRVVDGRKYCSKICANEAKTSGTRDHYTSFYGTMPWIKLSKLIKERDGYRCWRCGNDKNRLITHHLIRRRAGGRDDPENLITLCASCHTKIHAFHKRVNQLNIMATSY